MECAFSLPLSLVLHPIIWCLLGVVEREQTPFTLPAIKRGRSRSTSGCNFRSRSGSTLLLTLSPLSLARPDWSKGLVALTYSPTPTIDLSLVPPPLSENDHHPDHPPHLPPPAPSHWITTIAEHTVRDGWLPWSKKGSLTVRVLPSPSDFSLLFPLTSCSSCLPPPPPPALPPSPPPRSPHFPSAPLSSPPHLHPLRPCLPLPAHHRPPHPQPNRPHRRARQRPVRPPARTQAVLDA